MKKNDVIEIVISGIDFPSKPFGIYNEKKCYANINLAIGHKIRGKISKIKKDKILLSNIEIISDEINIKKPFCDKFNICGGCSFQYFSYDDQLTLKVNMVYKLIDSYVKNKDFIKLAPIKLDKQLEYRNKMEFSFGNEKKDGPIILGLHKKNSFHDIVNVDNCLLIDENFRKILTLTNEFFKNETFYHKITHRGFLRNLIIRKGHKTKEISVNIITTSQKEDYNIITKYKEELLKLELSHNITSIIHTINDNKSDSVRADKEYILYGRRDISEKIFDLNFKISPYSFFQTNSYGIEKLYEQVIKFLLEIKKNYNPVVFDLFSGTGTIGQIVSKYSLEVYGIEIISEAVVKANENAKENKISNTHFIDGDVFEKLDEFDKKNIKPDVLILDPPRNGVGEKTIEKLLKYSVKNVIYVSCNPKTLATDLKYFEENEYILKKIVCVEMFPFTNHIETVALIELANTLKY